MTNEIDNLLKGVLASTVEFDTNRKIIGVSNSNLTPNAEGIPPLGKQGAFKKEEKESNDFIETFDTAMSEALPREEETIESLDLPNLVDNAPLIEPKEEDITLENPVQVENLQSLESIVPEYKEEEVPQETVAPVEATTTLDIQLPQMPEEVIAEAPSGLNDSLFVDTPEVSTPEVAAPAIEPEVPSDLNANKVEDLVSPASNEQGPMDNVPGIIDLDARLEEKRNELIERMKALTEAELVKYSEEIKAIFSENKEINPLKETEQSIDNPKITETNVENPLINDALSQINNMVIPDSGMKL